MPAVVQDHMLREDNWLPRTNDAFVIFGEESVSRLARQFGLSTRAAVEAFRNYKPEGGKPELELKRLFAAAETLPGSSVECERGFSMMNETVWDKRNRLRVESVSSTMFLKLNGVPLEKFDPYPFVRSWLATGNRLSTSWVPGAAPTKTVDVHQELLQQIFM